MNDFVAIDFETAKYSRESACAAGLVKYHNGKEIDAWYSLVRPPELYIRPDFTDIHGLTVEDVKDAPAFAELWENAVKPFIGDFPLAAHNAAFDMGVLQAALEWYGLPVPPLRYFCTCTLARRAWPEMESHALAALAGNFGIAYNAHNALDDARTCGKIALLAAEKYGSGSLAELLAAAGTGLAELVWQA